MAKIKNKGKIKQLPKNPKTFNNPKTVSKKENKLPYFVLFGIIIFTAILYSKSLSNGFVNWDDKEFFIQNNFCLLYTSDAADE